MKKDRCKVLFVFLGLLGLMTGGCSQQSANVENNGAPPPRPLPISINGVPVLPTGSISPADIQKHMGKH
jgi:hypothetical protein